MPNFIQLVLVTAGLALVQGLAALPWLMAFNPQPPRELRLHISLLVGVMAAAGLMFGFYLDFNSDPSTLANWGRVAMAFLHLQLGLDFFVITFWLLLTFWPKGGAVSLAAFQEGVRQPMFWLLTFVGVAIMAVSVYIPFFTFGEDLKMVKELCYALTMLTPALFGVIAACTSVAEEIEGKTAVTLLSKPISRRQFLLGKFIGITLAALAMTLLLGWILVWIILLKTRYEMGVPGQAELLADPAWPALLAGELFPTSSAGDLIRGCLLWVHNAGVALPGLIIGFCQVAVLVAVAIALATRLPVVLNISICVLVYFLGHLTPVLAEVSRGSYALVHFVAQLFETVLPPLDHFDVGNAIIRDVPLDPVKYAIYTVNIAIYALVYVAIALLAGLVLFEDRDVA